MKKVQDTIQGGLVKSTAIGFSITECNEILTFVSLIMAIGFTVYKFFKFKKRCLKREN